MTNNEPVKFSVEAGVATIELNRPETGNAVDPDLAEAFANAAQVAALDSDVAVILLRANGKNFCVGGNLTTIAASAERTDGLRASVQHMNRGVAALHEATKPVIAAVQGAAAGGGLGFVLAADLVVIEATTRFVFAYPAVGLTPDCGVSWLLPRVVGVRKALVMALGGEAVEAEEALQLGLATSLAAPGEVQADAAELARALAAGAATALGGARRLLRDAPEISIADAMRREEETIVQAIQSEEAQTRMAAFLAR